MSKKTLILISVILILILGSLIGYYFLVINKNTTGTGDIPTGFRRFFPFGGSETPLTPTNNGTTTEPVTEEPSNNEQNFTQKLRKVSSEPVAGAGLMDIKTGTIIRYIEKATGHIFEVELFSPKQVRVSNTTIPVVYDAVWGNKNNSLVARYLKDDNQSVDTYALILKNLSTSTENTIAGISLPSSISDVVASGDSVFYLIQGQDSTTGYVSNFDGSNKKQIWTSNIKELNSQFINSKTVGLNTKPAQNVLGYLYTVDVTNGASKRLLGDILGLSSLVDSPLENILYIEQSGDIKTFVYNTKNKTTISITPPTFPEKCVWSKKEKTVFYCAVPSEYLEGNSLISWYKGLVSYSDDIWKYDTKNNTASIIEKLYQDSKEEIDVIKPVLSENEQYLVFMNKKDNTLWSLDLLNN